MSLYFNIFLSEAISLGTTFIWPRHFSRELKILTFLKSTRGLENPKAMQVVNIIHIEEIPHLFYSRANERIIFYIKIINRNKSWPVWPLRELFPCRLFPLIVFFKGLTPFKGFFKMCWQWFISRYWFFILNVVWKSLLT